MLIQCTFAVACIANIALIEAFTLSHQHVKAPTPATSISWTSFRSIERSISTTRRTTSSSVHNILKASNIGSENSELGALGLDEKSMEFAMGYLNKHHSEVLRKFAMAFSPLGVTQAKKNAFSGGSFNIESASVVNIQYAKYNESGAPHNSYMELDVTVQIRGEKEPKVERQKVLMDATPNTETRSFRNLDLVPSLQPDSSFEVNTIDDFIRRLNRLCVIVNSLAATGKLVQLGFQIGGDKLALLKEDMYLNQVPHNRYIRKYFYDLAAKAALDAVVACSNGEISNRMTITSLFPESNSSMDSYRLGTLLELIRSVAITLAEQNLRVRVCVQGSMGVGIFTATPKQLSGAATLLQRMDWQSGPGEENEGMVGDYINFGGVGKEHVVDAGEDRRGNEIKQDDVFILLCPQSMIGVDASIMDALSEMVDAVGDRPIILLNPDLTDKISSQGQQNIRGRKERMEFADSFQSIYHFQNIYVSGTSYFPILGAVSKPSHRDPWVAYQRRDGLNNGGEVYVPILSTEKQADGEMILANFD
eukprot:scaffold11268_cov267-Chaetoceros_neogracile.AAC.1